MPKSYFVLKCISFLLILVLLSQLFSVQPLINILSIPTSLNINVINLNYHINDNNDTNINDNNINDSKTLIKNYRNYTNFIRNQNSVLNTLKTNTVTIDDDNLKDCSMEMDIDNFIGTSNVEYNDYRNNPDKCDWLKHNKHNMSLSFIIPTRHDFDPNQTDYLQYRSELRMINLFKSIAFFDYYARFNMQYSVEIIIIEWNYDETRKHIYDTDSFKELKSNITIPVRFIIVNNSIHNSLSNFKFTSLEPYLNNEYKIESSHLIHKYCHKCRVFEWHAKNMAAYRSCGNILVFMNSDSLPSQRLISYLSLVSDNNTLTEHHIMSDPNTVLIQKRRNHAFENGKFVTQDDKNYDIFNMDSYNNCGLVRYTEKGASCEFQLVYYDTFAKVGGYLELPQGSSIDSEFYNRLRFIYGYNIYKLEHNCICYHQKHNRNKQTQITCDFLQIGIATNAAKHNKQNKVYDIKKYKNKNLGNNIHFLKNNTWGYRNLILPEIIWFPTKN